MNNNSPAKTNTHMIKSILIAGACILFLGACVKDKNATPKPHSDEYFSFDANGVHYNYPQEKGSSLFTGDWCTLSAGPVSASVGYQIYASSLKDPVAEGIFLFSFNSNNLPIQDTIILDGTYNRVSITDINVEGNSFELAAPCSGSLIFTQKSNTRIEGKFEFDAQQAGGSVIHITNGKFSIIP